MEATMTVVLFLAAITAGILVYVEVQSRRKSRSVQKSETTDHDAGDIMHTHRDGVGER